MPDAIVTIPAVAQIPDESDQPFRQLRHSSHSARLDLRHPQIQVGCPTRTMSESTLVQTANPADDSLADTTLRLHS